MANIQLSEDENLEKAIGKFKRLVEKEGIIREFKKRQYYQKPSVLKHERKKTIRRKEIRSLKKLKDRKKY